jgi:hypothetical protein
MDTSTVMTQIEASIEQQVLLTGGDPQTESAARVLLTALEPAVARLALDLAEQAAAEVAAQLPGHQVEVVVSGGEPSLRVRPEEVETAVGEALDARLTLRLPPRLKEMIEQAADERGESLNTWMVRTISSKAGGTRRRVGRSVEGTMET